MNKTVSEMLVFNYKLAEKKIQNVSQKRIFFNIIIFSESTSTAISTKTSDLL